MRLRRAICRIALKRVCKKELLPHVKNKRLQHHVESAFVSVMAERKTNIAIYTAIHHRKNVTLGMRINRALLYSLFCFRFSFVLALVVLMEEINIRRMVPHRF